MTAVLRQFALVAGFAAILLAMSEYVFGNEGPVASLTGAGEDAPDPFQVIWMWAFYLLPGWLCAALLPMMTSAVRIVLAGAFVGWSIEAALVPVAYENAPFSYVWVSMSWHALVCVGAGVWLLRRVMAAAPAIAVSCMILMGALWAVWATWLDADLPLDPWAFGLVAVTAGLLLGTGHALADLAGAAGIPGRVSLRMAIVANLAFWLLNAVPYPVAASGLAAVAGVTALALVRAPVGPLRVERRPLPFWRYGLPMVAAASAVTWTIAIDVWRIAPESEAMTGLFFLASLLPIAWALWTGLRGDRTAT